MINDWAENITMDKIKDLITFESLSLLTKLVLVSANYFKGDWAEKFDSKMTISKTDFYITQDQIIQVVCSLLFTYL